MLVSVQAYHIEPNPSTIHVDVDLGAFDPNMDADAVRETLEIIICQDGNCIDINEEDLYIAAERIYQALKNG